MSEFRELDQIHGAVREANRKMDRLLEMVSQAEPRITALEEETREIGERTNRNKALLDRYAGGLALIGLVVAAMLPAVVPHFFE